MTRLFAILAFLLLLAACVPQGPTGPGNCTGHYQAPTGGPAFRCACDCASAALPVCPSMRCRP